MKNIILRSSLSPGDIVLLTAAVRDLHQCYPGQFVTDVRTPFPDLWQDNPHLTCLDESDPGVHLLDCHYPLINRSNRTPYHVIHGFIEFLNDRLNLQIRPTAFKGDIHPSEDEKSWDCQVRELVGEDIPFWIIVSGGKYDDVTIKWWDARRFQEVVDHFNGKVQFVQVGAMNHFHPQLTGVIDLRWKTDLRQLVRLVYNAQGVLCPVTLLMHLAAAVPVKGGLPKNRACVVVAGGREPPHWEAYPHHQFIHTNGALLCCDDGGCWKSRVVPLGDGDEHDHPGNLCVDVIGGLPRCMDMITSYDVIRRVESYFAGKAIEFLNPTQAKVAKRAVSAGVKREWDGEALQAYVFRRESEKFIHSIPPYPGSFQGRGIVICGGGVTYFTNAWICINMLRRLKCDLPIQLWHLGEQELDKRMKVLVKPLNVCCVDALKVKDKRPARILNGYELKSYSILYCPYKEVMLIDADNTPVVDPQFLFDTPQFKKTGAIFWPDYGRLARSQSIWRICGESYGDEPAFESGQVVVDKERCWQALCLTMWYNEHSDYYYHHILGDKDTFHMAFRKLDKEYAMPSKPIHPLRGTMCQHDFKGRRVFQHRNLAKWRFLGDNSEVSGFQHEAECLEFLEKLRKRWDGRVRKQTDGLTGQLQETNAAKLAAFRGKDPNRKHVYTVPTKRVVFRGPINAFTGYGLHSCQIISDLEKMGYTVKVRPTELDYTFAKVQPEIRKKLVRDPQPEEWELILHPPNIRITPNKRTVRQAEYRAGGKKRAERIDRIISKSVSFRIGCPSEAEMFP